MYIGTISLLSIFDLENLGHGHGVQYSQWFPWMANIKATMKHFPANSHRFPDISISFFNLENVGQGDDV